MVICRTRRLFPVGRKFYADFRRVSIIVPVQTDEITLLIQNIKMPIRWACWKNSRKEHRPVVYIAGGGLQKQSPANWWLVSKAYISKIFRPKSHTEGIENMWSFQNLPKVVVSQCGQSSEGEERWGNYHFIALLFVNEINPIKVSNRFQNSWSVCNMFFCWLKTRVDLRRSKLPSLHHNVWFRVVGYIVFSTKVLW